MGDRPAAGGGLPVPPPRPAPAEARPRDRGSASVLAVGAIAALLVTTLGALDVTRAVVTSHRARAAADLAALAGATVLSRAQGDDAACLAASRIAARNGGRLTGCRPAADLSVEVTVVARSERPWPQQATARARAGPGQQ